MVQVDFPAYALSMHKQNAVRITKDNNSTELAQSPFCYNTNVDLVDVNLLAKFDEIPLLPVQDIKEKPKCRVQELQSAITLKELPLALIFCYKCSSCRYQCVRNI